MYKLVKIKGKEPLGTVMAHGKHTQALRPLINKLQQPHSLELAETTIQEPTVGAVLVVETIREWYRTNVVTRICSDNTIFNVRTVTFETASGSVYKWITNNTEETLQ